MAERQISSLVNLNRTERAVIAEDTLEKLNAGWYSPSKRSRVDFAEDIQFSIDHSILYTENESIGNKKLISTTTTENRLDAEIEFRNCTTLQAAYDLVIEHGEQNVGVLNFASAKNPGGGFRKGSNAQEESLARSSSLYLAITKEAFLNSFYHYHRLGKNPLYSHRMIYSPRVTIFKDDNGELLSVPYHVGVVTAPAPNAGVARDEQASQNTMDERVQRILSVFEVHQHETLVLGAFGCGVFRNDPTQVAIIFRQHLQSERFKYSFKRIIFAILDPEMCDIFQKVFSDTIQYNPTKGSNQPVKKSQRKDKNSRKQAHLAKYQNQYYDD